MQDHHTRVVPIVEQVAKFYKAGIPFRIYKGNTNSTRSSSKTRANTVNISSLHHVVSINAASRTCLVEPNVTMKDLVTATLKYQLIPPVVPEFTHTTVGGAFAGTAGESSSFRHGLFDDCVMRMEMVLGDGDKIMVSKTRHSDLFEGAKGTFGTLGISTLFEIQLVDAKKFVQLQYLVSRNMEEARSHMTVQSTKPAGQVDFLDGIMFAPDSGLVMVGSMVNQHDIDKSGRTREPIRKFTKARDPWFYLRAQEVMNMSKDQVPDEPGEQSQGAIYNPVIACDIIPLVDYLFRYDRGGFWTGRYAFKYFKTPFNRVTRTLLNKFFSSKVMYAGLHGSGLIQNYIVQDAAIPYRSTLEFVQWLYEDLKILSLWFVPLKLGEASLRTKLNPHRQVKAIVDATSTSDISHISFGIWGLPQGNAYDVNRSLEMKVKDVNGCKCLYAQTYYAEDEFWGPVGLHDKDHYINLRRKYKACTLPDLYTKVGGTSANQKNMMTGIWKHWPMAGLRGVVSVLRRKDYPRKS